MDTIASLQKKVTDLEYRLRLIEKYLDSEVFKLIRQDTSTMNALRIEILNKMKAEGFDMQEFGNRWGVLFEQRKE